MIRFRGRQRDEAAITRDLVEALANLDATVPVGVEYVGLAKGGGAVRGTVEVPDRQAYAAALVACARVLGTDGGRVSVYLTGVLPDGAVIEPADLGLFVRPNGPQILAGLA
ncbi:hypothetical protein [Nocardioides sp. AE5]|uniref:hypothetical protein n=1 Tax=Nocardioides sp. AE5 TaxID=2962573 RepID=UPI0028829742|nr:hypothetical protein [Nocardioides sp. AE5]MDT0203652.1 hypothetical protein [Nocardioides sp. AE5]